MSLTHVQMPAVAEHSDAFGNLGLYQPTQAWINAVNAAYRPELERHDLTEINRLGGALGALAANHPGAEGTNPDIFIRDDRIEPPVRAEIIDAFKSAHDRTKHLVGGSR